MLQCSFEGIIRVVQVTIKPTEERVYVWQRRGFPFYQRGSDLEFSGELTNLPVTVLCKSGSGTFGSLFVVRPRKAPEMDIGSHLVTSHDDRDF
jgi:hypothetical protein